MLAMRGGEDIYVQSPNAQSPNQSSESRCLSPKTNQAIRDSIEKEIDSLERDERISRLVVGMKVSRCIYCVYCIHIVTCWPPRFLLIKEKRRERREREMLYVACWLAWLAVGSVVGPLMH